jgi:hypothetical protein
MGRLDGKVFVLSAAAQGIGRAVALVWFCLYHDDDDDNNEDDNDDNEDDDNDDN